MIEGDIHRDAAAKLFNVPPEDVTAEQRQRARRVHYGVQHTRQELLADYCERDAALSYQLYQKMRPMWWQRVWSYLCEAGANLWDYAIDFVAPEACPSCGSLNLSVDDHGYHCQYCSYSWKEDE